jgi:hypothetical protein
MSLLARSPEKPVKRRRLLAAVRDRMQHRAAVREAEHARPTVRCAEAPVPVGERSGPAQPDHSGRLPEWPEFERDNDVDAVVFPVRADGRLHLLAAAARASA